MVQKIAACRPAAAGKNSPNKPEKTHKKATYMSDNSVPPSDGDTGNRKPTFPLHRGFIVISEPESLSTVIALEH